jgi:hypothetical protein
MKLVLDDGTEYAIARVDTMNTENGLFECELDKRTPEEIKHNWKGIRMTGVTDVSMAIQLKTMDTAAASALMRTVVAEKIKEEHNG